MVRALTLQSIEAAAERIAPYAVKTPLLEHPDLNARTGARILMKAENLQRVGAFKFRGAYNKIVQVDRAKFPGGVVACSSGNHAQGVAAAATLCGLKSLVVMPRDAPALKIARAKRFGAEVVLYDRASEDRDAIARRYCEQRTADFVHPFDDLDIMAGQGTVGLELMHQAKAQGATPDVVLVCCSGGGLVSGIAVAVKAANAETEVRTVEPEGFDDFARTLALGKRAHNTRKSGSICDGLLTETPGVQTWAAAGALLSPGLVISDEEAAAAVRYAYGELKLVLEPSGAAALASVLSGKIPVKGRTIAVILSGGNVDPALYATMIQA